MYTSKHLIFLSFSYKKMSSFQTGFARDCLLVTLVTSFTLALTKRLVSIEERERENTNKVYISVAAIDDMHPLHTFKEVYHSRID